VFQQLFVGFRVQITRDKAAEKDQVAVVRGFGIRWIVESELKGDLNMRYLKYMALLAVLMLPLTYSQAQVAVGIGVNVGPHYVDYDDGPPVCQYGYYSYYPYACAPYGFYGPQWFASGVFIGAGPWYHWGHAGYWGRGYWGHGGYYGRGFVRGYEHGYARGNYSHNYARNYARGGNGRGYVGGGFHGGGAVRSGGGYHGGGGGFHGGGGHR
jgi:hypothetical protein